MEIRTRRLLLTGPIFTVIYGIYNYFLFSIVFGLFGVTNSEIILRLTLVVCVSYLLGTIIEYKKSNPITRILSTISEIWKGTSLFLLWTTIAIYIVNFFIHVPIILIELLIFLFVPLIVIYSIYTALNIRIKEVKIDFEKLEEDINFIQISDIHFGSIRNKGLLNNIINEIKQINKDLSLDFLLITGDLADGSSNIDQNSFAAFKKSEIPIYFTPGNHDFYPGISNVLNAATNADVRILSNDMVVVKGVQIMGIPYGHRQLVEITGIDGEKIDPNKLLIALNHVPIGWDLFRDYGVDLLLSGHTHAGQFFPFNFFVKKVYPYFKGLYNEKDKYLYVSEGIGTLNPPMRLGTTAEMVLFRLKSTRNKKNNDEVKTK
ncbi:metallophosphoesterase [Methanobrevibacter cuticularis]|uniref:metallophosphoesterase n=1 Tax=Methanobrevibacter cuticularis TaxID=47311 RepID=UPI000834141E|nr:metallophosphoesterase [Methanobrevibacter cuticularis]